jgi:single-strand DNA-binding protein
MQYNRIILVGRLTRDPEAKYTPSGVPVTTFAIAVDRPQSSEARQQGAQKETDFFDIVCWRQTAEYAANYLQKGKLILAEGRVQIRAYVDREGQQRKATEVVADNIRMMEKRGEGEGGYGGDDAFGGGSQATGGYDQRSPQAAPARGGYDQGGGQAAPAARGGGERPQSAPAAPARGGQAAPAGRGGSRNQPVDNFEDNDMEDPFAE